ncbi:Retrovirus-related Pol polyprotein from transposon TNT 1-94 [Sesamum angolense]|uniref:Retrovirus-related Pol polyprotein from transposon TNT 1-94 n=1 Tax=Sesamum angolense TaxID=2727404 RepID=A0AAE2BQY2_9LAMI|nr:Retrovirus-related Pol polyprotein from transposon TNT 1-94 [Sesamum angolense]
MKNAKATAVPLAAHFQLCKEQSPKNESKTEQMKMFLINAIGSVMYLMVSTRPDIAYAVSCLSRYMSNADLHHWKHLNGYSGTLLWALVIIGNNEARFRPLGFGPRWNMLNYGPNLLWPKCLFHWMTDSPL